MMSADTLGTKLGATAFAFKLPFRAMSRENE